MRTVNKSEKCCGNKSCSVSGGGIHFGPGSTQSVPPLSKAAESRIFQLCQPSEPRGTTKVPRHRWILLDPTAWDWQTPQTPNTFLMIIIQADGGVSFQFSLPSQVTFFFPNRSGLLTTEDILKIQFLLLWWQTEAFQVRPMHWTLRPLFISFFFFVIRFGKIQSIHFNTFNPMMLYMSEEVFSLFVNL